jgi:nicotinate-nucleotide adenylyltransferase
MEFLRRAISECRRVGVLPGTFNPVTLAHIALGEAALAYVDAVVFTLPRMFPHKEFTGASFEQRVTMLTTALTGHPQFSIAVTDRGLFAEIAEELRPAYPEGVQISFICGRDAAERIAGWDYGRAGAFREMLRRFDLLVASRGGSYAAPPEFEIAVRHLEIPAVCEPISATEVRQRVARGEPWEHLVPGCIVELVRKIYG